MKAYQVMRNEAKGKAGDESGEVGYSTAINGVYCKATPTAIRGKNPRIEKVVTWYLEDEAGTIEEITLRLAEYLMEARSMR